MTERSAAAVRPARWRIYSRLGRVSNLPTVWTNGLAGLILAGAAPEPIETVALAVGLSLFYVAGMFLNDAFDRRYDRELRPERPIPSGFISVAEVYAVGFVLMATGLTVLAALGVAMRGSAIEPLIAGTVLGLLIVYYDFRHKRDPLSPVVMAVCRSMIYLIAGALVGSAFSVPVLMGAAVLTAYVIGLTYVAKQENLDEVRNLWPLLFLAAPLGYALTFLQREPWSVLWLLALLGWVSYALSFLTRRDGRDIPRTVVSLIAGISLLDVLLIQGAGGSPPWIVAGLGAFALTLLLQRYVPGT